MFLKPYGYAVTLADLIMIDELILAFIGSAVIVMPYPRVLIYYPKKVLMWCVTGIPRNFVQYAVLVRCPGSHPDGLLRFLLETLWRLPAHHWKTARISNVVRTTRNLTNENTRTPRKNSEESNGLMSFVDLFTTRKVSVFDPHVGTMAVSLSAV